MNLVYFASVAAALVVAAQPLSPWTEVFHGKPTFGFCTAVHSTGDRLLFTDSPRPAGADGGDVYMLDKNGTITQVLQVDEQGVTIFRVHGNRIYVPGTDATEDWTLGNYYLSTDKGANWQKFRNIPVGIHIWDMAEFRGKLYASTGSFRDNLGYAAVCESADGGKTWTESLIAPPLDSATQFARSYLLLPMKDGLYASYVSLDSTASNMPGAPQDFFRFDGKTWNPLKLLDDMPPRRYFGLRGRVMRDGEYALIGGGPNSFLLRNGAVTHVNGMNGLNSYDFVSAPDGFVYTVATSQATGVSAVYRCLESGLPAGTSSFEHVLDLPEDHEGLSIAWHQGLIYVGTRATGGGKVFSASPTPVSP